MHRDHNIFTQSIHAKQKVVLTFMKADGERAVRTCAPMDFGPSRRAKDGVDRYHFWDYDSASKNHVLSLTPDRIIRIEATEDGFDPAEFITWDTSKSPWFIPRNWGIYS
jgi:hypothetical protein